MGWSHRSLTVWLRLLAAFLLLAIVARMLVTTYRVVGASMRETLQDGDRILVCELPWVVRPVRCGDILILAVAGEVLVKRVVACPGDSISMEEGRVLRNGRPLHEEIPAELNRDDDFPEYHLGEDEYFVLGDNRRVSVDSREFGPVGGGQMIGRVLLRISGHGVSTVAALERAGP
jgi:signal peptidase I